MKTELQGKASKPISAAAPEWMAEVKQREISRRTPRASLVGRVLGVWSATPRVSGGKHMISDVALEFKSSAASTLSCTVNNALQFLITSPRSRRCRSGRSMVDDRGGKWFIVGAITMPEKESHTVCLLTMERPFNKYFVSQQQNHN